MKLPNAERAFVDVRKLRDYCLSTDHPRGQHKARLFKRVLGWTADQAEDVRRRLLEAVLREDAGFLGADDYGQRYALDSPVQGAGGVAIMRSLWFIRHGEDFPRFTSCYVLSKEHPS
ncbi:MAG: DUF6883 domain-containing protein [Nitrospirota bacterium]